MDDNSGVDICRVCRSEGVPERPLFHPCICTGSIKWIHQECLVQWMRYSRKEYCELCSHRFSFTPIYSPDMPQHLPLRDVAGGLLSSIATALKYWLHYTLVALAWLGLVPLTACRIYRCLFSGSVESIMRLPFDLLKTQNLPSDVFHGCFVITCTLFAFVGMVWLREQIIQGGGPDWLEPEHDAQAAQQQQLNQQQNDNNQPLEEVNDNEHQPEVNNVSNHNNNSVSSGDDNNENEDGGIDDFNEDEANNGQTAALKEIHNLHGDNEINNENRLDCADSDIPSDMTTSGHSTAGNNTGNISTNINITGVDKINSDFHNISFSNSDFQVDAADENLKLEKLHRNMSGSSGGDNTNRNIDSYSDISLRKTGIEVDNNLHSASNDPDFHNRAERFEGVENFNQLNNEDEEPIEPAAEIRNQIDEMEAGVGVPEGGENAQEDGNWNPIEWDRAVEELTWERLLGLDGSMVFIEHVFWIMALNTLFILVFAFLPYHFGNFAISVLGLQEKTVGTHFEGLITTLCGYCVIEICLIVLHTFASLLGLQRSKRILGLCYVIVKVSLISVVEVGVFPLICGWWLDICSLSMFDATFKDRETSFRLAPGTSMFIHWLVGMVYMYYSATFIQLLREVVRPGVLWFLINLNDPDFSPIQEMIHTPIIHHVRRLLVSSVIFGTAVLFMLWFPIRIIRYLWPTFLPYAVALHIEFQINELSLELILLQIILPALLEQSQTRIWMKSLLRLWCRCVGWLLGIQSYLLGEEVEQTGNAEHENNENNQGLFNGFGAAHHQALLPREGPIGVQPYQKPSLFCARLIGLIFAVSVSLILASLIALTVPVWIGRRVMSFWFIGIPHPSASTSVANIGEETSMKVHELYTAACGTYLCWLTARAVVLLRSWIPQGRAAISDTKRLKQWCIWGTKSLIAFCFLLGVIPFLFGLLLELVLVVPARVPLYQTPVLFLWQDWVLGVLYTKIACAMIMMSPDCRIRRAIERIYRDGIRNMDLPFIFSDLVIPVMCGFSLALAVPYAIAHTIIPLITSNTDIKNLAARMVYPSLLMIFILSTLIVFQIRQFRKLYEHIKNDKYLVGKRLVNYDQRRNKTSNAL